MAAPNIAQPTTITGKTSVVALTTSAQAVVNNAASSGKVLKINTLMIANIDGTNDADVTINYYSEDDLGGTATAFVNTIRVPADSTLVVISKGEYLYLEEDRTIGALASANSDLTAIVSYEEIS